MTLRSSSPCPESASGSPPRCSLRPLSLSRVEIITPSVRRRTRTMTKAMEIAAWS